MHPPLDSIQYLLDTFIEDEHDEEEDILHRNRIQKWLKDERDYVEVVWSEQEEWGL